MKDVFAAEHYGGLVTKTTDHANIAVIFFRVVFVQLEVHILLIVQTNTLFVQAGQTAILTSESAAFMTTR